MAAATNTNPTGRRTERAVPSQKARLYVAQLLAVLGLCCVTGGLAWGLAPWVAIVVLGVLLLAVAFLVSSPPRGNRRTPQ
jgi:4-hydroxybenzoate polyprenyltransferase